MRGLLQNDRRRQRERYNSGSREGKGWFRGHVDVSSVVKYKDIIQPPNHAQVFLRSALLSQSLHFARRRSSDVVCHGTMLHGIACLRGLDVFDPTMTAIILRRK